MDMYGSIINNVGENSSVLFLYGDVKNKYIGQIPIIIFVLELYVCKIKKYMVLAIRHKPYIFNFYLLQLFGKKPYFKTPNL